MGKLEGIFVYDIDDLQQVAAAHMAKRSRVSSDTETLIAENGEVHERQGGEHGSGDCGYSTAGGGDSAGGDGRRIHTRLGSLSAEQAAAVRLCGGGR